MGLSASSPSLDLCRNSVLQILEKSLCAFFQNRPPNTAILQQRLLISNITSDAQTKEPDHNCGTLVTAWSSKFSQIIKLKKRVWEDFVEMKFPHKMWRIIDTFARGCHPLSSAARLAQVVPALNPCWSRLRIATWKWVSKQCPSQKKHINFWNAHWIQA